MLTGNNVPAVGPIEVNFPDPGLEAAIRDAIAKPTGPIYDTDLLGLTVLDASSASISDPNGLEYCTDLTDIDLRYNQISNIGLLAGLANLNYLDLDFNQISDPNTLSRLTNLIGLYLDVNQLSDISPLVANAGIGSGDQVDLQSNSLSCTSITTHIPTLQGRGATVQWTDSDVDAYSLIDACDNCPFTSNPGQEDTGGIADDPPDGIGDAYQCGDVTGDGKVNSADATMIVRKALALTAPVFNVPRNCDVTDDESCNSADATMVVRKALGLNAPAFGNNCGDYTGGCECDSDGNCLP